ncbi:hypothetical protein ORI89_18880 [Sphingobacterium sp. UT-1RO-CII-1]|uniref:hypothetical protein n=1 Tax=Sphingobacterium sp. UT-1RO-CII-1 TaxID=2995225 RepID=UPI00227A28DB|nr:hypothetical protein [Sphingobacterium sp. UT-1RO-CII-1]MCY4781723.1 hypothetical protein [Sphingobacterium sp. UT-1RO-CII-1]
MNDKKKIIKYLNQKGISKNKFYLTTGLSVGFLDSGNSLGVDKLRMIIDKYHDLNPMWFLKENEPMILENLSENLSGPLKRVCEESYSEINKDFDREKLIEILQKTIFYQEQAISYLRDQITMINK